MSEAVKKRNDKALRNLVAGLVSAVGETLSSLVDKPLEITAEDGFAVVDASDWLRGLGGTKAIIRGALDKDFANRHLLIVIDQCEAITLSGLLMVTPEDAIAEMRSSGELEGDVLEAFSEVGNVLCSGIDGTLREVLGSKVGLRLKDHGTLKPGIDKEEFLPDSDIVVYDFAVTIGDLPKTTAHILLDPETATTWNRKRALLVDAAAATADEGDDPTAHSLTCAEEEIPQAPIQGRMSAFIVSPEAQAIVRQCGRRLGLEIHRHSRTDIPNPAAHRGQIVLIEVPIAEDKRFEWARRIKAHHREIPVVLLIHQPSKSRVLQGFQSKADALCAWPSTEPQLSTKLEGLLARLLSDGEPTDDD